jgi:hypothetical protein
MEEPQLCVLQLTLRNLPKAGRSRKTGYQQHRLFPNSKLTHKFLFFF